MKRTFIAIKIDPAPELLDFFTLLKEELDGESVKWVDENNLHITLCFLGDTDSHCEAAVVDLLDNITKGKGSLTFNLMGCGRFGHLQSLKVVWIGIDRCEALKTLRMNLENGLKELGIEPENKPFIPHLTLGRVKYIKRQETLFDFLKNHKNSFFQQVIIDEIIYYESQLTPKGPVYIPIHKVRL